MYTKLDPLKFYNNDGSLTRDGNLNKQVGEGYFSSNNMAVIILAGGQGTRLGSSNPKGMYSLSYRQNENDPSVDLFDKKLSRKESLIHKQHFTIEPLEDLNMSLFEIHAAHVKRHMEKYKKTVKLLIMTSSYTHEMTEDFFAENDYFNLNKADVYFFKQGEAICHDMKGDPLQWYNGEHVTSPNGNGGLFSALEAHKLLDMLEFNRIEYVNVISVDNVLARILDPILIGYTMSNKIDVISKCVIQRKSENTGVFCIEDGHMCIKEYTEIVDEDPTFGELYNLANICNHYFSLSFLKEMKHKALPIHKAFKKIPFVRYDKLIKPTEPNGYKNEYFIFDVFRYVSNLDKIKVMVVKRELEFSPLKNSLNAETDNPLTCLQDLLNRSKIYLTSVGNQNTFNVLLHPNMTLYGEGLEALLDADIKDETLIRRKD